LLGLSPSASAADIKAAYRRLALRLHPDRNAGSAEAEEAFKRLNNAYQILSDPARRLAYDQALGYAPLPPRYHPRDRRASRPAGERPAGYRPPPTGPTWAEGYLTARWLGGLVAVVALVVAFLQAQSRAMGREYLADARHYAAAGDTLRALDEVGEALFHDPKSAEAHRLRGTFRQRFLGDWAGAYPDFKAALAYAEADDDSLRTELARVCLKLKKNEEALLHLNEAVRMNARNGWAFLLRGVAQAERGDTTAACRDWVRARQLDELRGLEFEDRYCRSIF
jgi:curved DNA-binding protein CbpA